MNRYYNFNDNKINKLVQKKYQEMLMQQQPVDQEPPVGYKKQYLKNADEIYKNNSRHLLKIFEVSNLIN